MAAPAFIATITLFEAVKKGRQATESIVGVTLTLTKV
jgi:hypothetical protein